MIWGGRGDSESISDVEAGRCVREFRDGRETRVAETRTIAGGTRLSGNSGGSFGD